MASDLLQSGRRASTHRDASASGNRRDERMRKDSIIRFSAVALALVTVAAVVFAFINFEKEGQYSTPYDGVWWLEDQGSLVAKRVDPGGPGDKAGIKVGDKLLAINNQPVKNA